MINWMNSWLRGIVIAVIISTIIEMIIPNGKIKKYIKTVMGVFIIFSIISPIISKMTGRDIDLIKYINKETNKYQQQKIDSIDTNYYIEQVYTETIEQDISKELNNRGYKVNRLKTEIETEEINYGRIKQIEMAISKDDKSIEPVEISVNKKEEKKREKISDEEIISIKKFLETTYGVEEKNIIIN